MDTTTATPYRIANAYDHPDWQGWGYLGERSRAVDEHPDRVVAADAAVIAVAEEKGWDDAQLFDWLNSKLGRWFGDVVFGARHTMTADAARAEGDKHRLFDLTRLVG